MWWRRRPVALAALVILLSVPARAGAHHDPAHPCTGEAETREGGGEADGECGAPPDTGPGPDCDPDSGVVAYYGAPPGQLEQTYIQIELTEPAPEGMMWAAAYNCAGSYLGGPYLVADPAWADIAAARDLARARLTPPLPAPNVSPSQAVVRFPTWLWVDQASWQPASASASQGAVTVRVDARPVSVTWDLEEGVRVCDGPGIPWSEQAQEEYEAQPEETRGRGNPACTFTFQHSSTVTDDDVYHASVTVTWQFSWALNGAPQGPFGTVDRSSDFDLRVGESQALITDY